MPRPKRRKTAVDQLFENEDLLVKRMRRIDFLGLLEKGSKTAAIKILLEREKVHTKKSKEKKRIAVLMGIALWERHKESLLVRLKKHVKQHSTKMAPMLGYWDIRGFAEPIRLMLEHAGASYEQKKYKSGGPPDFDRSAWTSVKDKLGLDFPNLPYWDDGEVKITESWAIMRHVGMKHGLLPEGVVAHALAEQAQGVVQDFRMSFVMLCYTPGFADNRTKFFAELPAKLARFETYLATHKWLAGDKLTFVDFALAEILDQMRLMEPTVFRSSPKIAAYVDNFFAQKNIAAYRASSRFRKFPCNGAMAQWGGGAEEKPGTGF